MSGFLLTLVLLGGCQEAGTGGTDAGPIQLPPFEELVLQFAYNDTVPLELEETLLEDREGILLYDISYKSPSVGYVPAFLIVPPGEEPKAAGIYVHWGQGNRSQFVDEGFDLGQLGMISLHINAPWNRTDYAGQDSADTGVQIVKDVRRGIDMLLARPDVDPSRIGYTGHSFGATWGGVLAGVEERVRTFVLMAGAGEISMYDTVPRTLDAIHYVGHAAPASLFFQFATHDEYISEKASQNYYNAASDPKSMTWYDADHALNDQAENDRRDWMIQELELTGT